MKVKEDSEKVGLKLNIQLAPLAFALWCPIGPGAGAEGSVEDQGLLSVPLSTLSSGV